MDDDHDKRLIEDPRHTDELLALADQDGRESLKGKYRTAEWIANQASVTLTVLLAGVGGSLAYAVKVFEPGQASALVTGAVAMCVYLTALCVVLVQRCLMLEPMPAETNEPVQWLRCPGLAMGQLRRQALVNLQARINEARQRNERTAISLTRIRMGAALSPIVFAMSMLLGATRNAAEASRSAPTGAAAYPAAPSQVAASAPGQGTALGR